MDKSESVNTNLLKCRALIEAQLSLGSGSEWTRRDYEVLVEKIFEKTGVLLSLSTVRRIWNDNFKNLPHKSTLDTLADFAGFADWQNFIELNETSEDIEVSNKETRSYSKLGLIVILIIIITITIYFSNECKKIDINGPVIFSYFQANNSSVPNVIVFEYNVNNIVADSFFIVESTNDYEKKILKVKKGKLTSSYHYPGNYEAFLVADDSIVKKLDIEIMSNSWVAMLNYQTIRKGVPYYFYNPEILINGNMKVTRDLIVDNNININNDLYLTYSKTFNTTYDVRNNYIFEANVKQDSIEISNSCPEIYIGLLFENGLCYIPLVHFGGQDNLQIKYGDTYLSSNDSDFSGFGCNIYNWQKISLASDNANKTISLNGEKVIHFSDTTDMGQFKGFSFTFEGIGSCDYVSLINSDGDTLYFNSFDGN